MGRTASSSEYEDLDYEDQVPDDSGYGICSWNQYNYWVLARPTPEYEWAEPNWHGESGTWHYIVGHNGIPADERQAFLDYVWEPTHCTHSYDCCGNTYSSRPQIIFSDDEVIIFRKRWHVNI